MFCVRRFQSYGCDIQTTLNLTFKLQRLSVNDTDLHFREKPILTTNIQHMLQIDSGLTFNECDIGNERFIFLIFFKSLNQHYFLLFNHLLIYTLVVRLQCYCQYKHKQTDPNKAPTPRDPFHKR